MAKVEHALVDTNPFQPVSAHPKSLAFFAALNSCLSVDKLPHPIRTRNADLLATWLEWRRWLVDANHSIVNDEFFDDPTCGFEPCIDGLVNAIKSDPEWQRGSYGFIDMTTITVLAAASLVLWRNRHMVIELTDALQDLLSKSDLGADIPIDYLRPPVPACYISLGKTLASSVVLPANHKNFGTCVLGSQTTLANQWFT
jgi:hypothetical protein